MPSPNAVDQMIISRMRELAPEYTDRREMVTGKYENGTLLADPASGLDAGYVWAHDADNRNSVPVVVGPGMGDYALVAAGVRVKTGLNRYGERVAIEPAGDSQNAAVVAQLQAAAAAARPVAAANITGGRVAPVGSGLDIFVEALDEVGWAGGTITGSSGDLPTGLGEFCWWIVYFPPGTSTPTYAATTPALVNTKDDLAASDAFEYGLPPGSLRTQALTVFTGETDITKDNTRILDMRRRGIEGLLLTGAAVLRTLASGVLTVGSESIVQVAAESGTTDDWQQVVVSGASRLLGFVADTGDTITAKQYAAGSDNLYTYAGTDLDFTGGQMLFGWWDADDAVLRILGGGAGGGAFTDLTDTPASYSGEAGKFAAVKGDETGMEFVDGLAVASKTRYVPTLLYDLELASAAVFDTNTTDDFGRSGIPAGYDHLTYKLVGRAAVAAAAVNGYTDLNNDTTGSNYDFSDIHNSSAAAAGAATQNSNLVWQMSGDSALADSWSVIEGELPFYGETTRHKTMLFTSGGRNSGSDFRLYHQRLWWKNTAAVSRIAFRVNNATNTFKAGSRLQIWGWKEETIGGVAYSTADVSNPPTDAELDSAFGTPATLPVPFTAIVNDNNADTAMWLVASNGTSWHYVSMTKAT